MENFVAYCWFHPALSTGLSHWKVGVCNRTSSETAGLASWFALNEAMDGQSILSLISLLDRIRSGWFDLICSLPAAATWSRARHFGNGQKPLRSRAEPFGLQSLDPNSTSKVTASNQQLEFVFWFFKEALTCPTKKVGSFWFSQKNSVEVWSLVHPQSGDFRSLEDNHGGGRGAVYLCQIGDSEHMRPMEICTNLDEIFNFIHLRWPELATTALDQGTSLSC